MKAKRATFKKGDRVRLTKAARRAFRKAVKQRGLPADVARRLDDISRKIDGTGEVVRVNPDGGAAVQFPRYHRPLDCSPEDLDIV